MIGHQTFFTRCIARQVCDVYSNMYLQWGLGSEYSTDGSNDCRNTALSGVHSVSTDADADVANRLHMCSDWSWSTMHRGTIYPGVLLLQSMLGFLIIGLCGNRGGDLLNLQRQDCILIKLAKYFVVKLQCTSLTMFVL
jgi:hypothetical protein